MPEPGTAAAIAGAITNALTAIKDLQLLAVDSYRALSRRLSLCLSTQRRGSAGGPKVCHSRGRCIHHPCRVPPRKSCYLHDQQVSRKPGGPTDISPDANIPTI